MRYNEGPGVKLTDSLVFHPGASIEGRYDSNALSRNSAKGAPYMRLMAHLKLATTSPQRRTERNGKVSSSPFRFELNSVIGYREYFSSEEVVKDQRALEVDAGVLLGWIPSAHFDIEIRDLYARQITPVNASILAGASAGDTVNQNINRLTAAVNLKPGGGRLVLGLSYSLNLNLFEDSTIAFSFNNRMAHEIALKGRYKLLPMTAITLDVSLSPTSYLDSANPNVSSIPIRVLAGFNGLITPKLGLTLKVGYGNGLYSDDDDAGTPQNGDSFSSVLATVGVRYSIGPTAKVSILYERLFMDSFIGNYQADHAVSFLYDHIVAQRFVLHARFAYTHRAIEGSGVNADQNLINLNAGIDYQIKDWIYVGIGYDLHYQNTSSGLTNTVGLVDFTRHQLYGKVGFSY
jgi:hypothetical protein